MVNNALLKIVWLPSRNLGLCIIVFLLEFSINSILHPSSQQILPMPYGLSGHMTQTAGQSHWSLDLCRSSFCSRPYCWELWKYDAHSVSHLEKKEPSLYPSLTTVIRYRPPPGQRSSLQLKETQRETQLETINHQHLQLLEKKMLQSWKRDLGDKPPQPPQDLFEMPKGNWYRQKNWAEHGKGRSHILKWERENQRQRDRHTSCFLTSFLELASASIPFLK